MAARKSGTFLPVGQLISLFVQMGCEVRTAENAVETADGDIFDCRYLVNTESGAFVVLLDLADDQFLSTWEVASWERRLDVTIPKPD